MAVIPGPGIPVLWRPEIFAHPYDGAAPGFREGMKHGAAVGFVVSQACLFVCAVVTMPAGAVLGSLWGASKGAAAPKDPVFEHQKTVFLKILDRRVAGLNANVVDAFADVARARGLRVEPVATSQLGDRAPGKPEPAPQSTGSQPGRPSGYSYLADQGFDTVLELSVLDVTPYRIRINHPDFGFRLIAAAQILRARDSRVLWSGLVEGRARARSLDYWTDEVYGTEGFNTAIKAICGEIVMHLFPIVPAH